MTRRIKYSAWILLSCFVVGSLVAPAAHYAFMMGSDVYGIGDHSPAHAIAHGPHTPDTHHHALPVDAKASDARASDADKQHLECEYADLFATFVADGPADLPYTDVVFADEVVAHHAFQVPIVLLPAPFQQRGPPISSSIA